MAKNKLKISVVIPTYGRVDALEKTLSGLSQQSLSLIDYEIIIVDDGPQDESEKVVSFFKNEKRVTVRYLRGDAQGVGPARNKGIVSANADIVVIIGNDIVPSNQFLEEHLSYHVRYNDSKCVVLGQTKLHEESKKSPFMQIWGDLPFRAIADSDNVPCYCFWTGNISFKKDFVVRAGLFDKSFKRIGFEDVELGYRLKKNGMKFVYNANAKGYHYHAYTIEEACKQQINHGYNFGILVEKLRALGFSEEIPMLGERFGLNNWNYTQKGALKSYIKKRILHKKTVIMLLEKWLKEKNRFGIVSAFMIPKLFTYYTNVGYQTYLNDTHTDVL